jgi:sec-independent protein translocase protein TatA
VAETKAAINRRFCLLAPKQREEQVAIEIFVNPVSQFILAVHGLNGGELVLVFVVILGLLGARGIPAFARRLGEGLRHFTDASKEVNDELGKAVGQDLTNGDLGHGVIADALTITNETAEFKDPAQLFSPQPSWAGLILWLAAALLVCGVISFALL